jgi:F0F1-type ATP synthase membrane subunit c/vacuolar-type H+-ATPase subunit K
MRHWYNSRLIRIIGAVLITLVVVGAAGVQAFAADDDPVATFEIDTDGDGIINNEDPDIDGDGIVNGEDSDIDGDGLENFDDGDPTETTGLDDGGTPPIQGERTLLDENVQLRNGLSALGAGLLAAIVGLGAWWWRRRASGKNL